MKVLITFALENEFAPWRDLRRFAKGGWAGEDSFSASIADADVAVALTGLGPRHAAAAAGRVAWSEFDSLGFCVSSGLAGSLRPGHQIGQVLAARSILSESLQPNPESQTLACSEPLVSFAAECGATVVQRLYTMGRVVTRVDEKRHLGATADAVEMESFEILRVACVSGIPAVAIRSISDTADEELPAELAAIFTDDGQVSMARVAGQLARHPSIAPALVRLGQQSKRAAESLAQFLDRYVPAVIERMYALDAKASEGAR